MKGYSISPNRASQIFVCGVKGAGKRSFISLFFPDRQRMTLKEVNFKTTTRNVLFILILDGIHLQNLEEEAIFNGIKDLYKSKKKINFSLLLVLGKADLIYDFQQTPNLISEVYQSYQAFLSSLTPMRIKFVAFSYLATKLAREFMLREMSDNDCVRASFLMAKLGCVFRETDTHAIQSYLRNHRGAISAISGEKQIQRFLSQWKEKI